MKSNYIEELLLTRLCNLFFTIITVTTLQNIVPYSPGVSLKISALTLDLCAANSRLYLPLYDSYARRLVRSWIRIDIDSTREDWKFKRRYLPLLKSHYCVKKTAGGEEEMGTALLESSMRCNLQVLLYRLAVKIRLGLPKEVISFVGLAFQDFHAGDTLCTSLAPRWALFLR